MFLDNCYICLDNSFVLNVKKYVPLHPKRGKVLIVAN